MTLRKRRQPTPDFKLPPPFQPITGERAPLRADGIHPYCAMVQIAAEDIYRDYVVCRGFDPRIRKFIDYAAGNAGKPGISVAKPFGKRAIGTYEVAQIFPAMLPVQGTEEYTPPSPVEVDWRLGQNPGTAENEAGGHPQSLSDSIVRLIDHNGKEVKWLLLDAAGEGSGATVHFEIDEYDEYSGTFYAVLTTLPPDGVVPGLELDGRIALVDVDGCLLDEPPEELIGRRGHAHWQRVLGDYDEYTLAWVVGGLCCPEVEPLAE